MRAAPRSRNDVKVATYSSTKRRSSIRSPNRSRLRTKASGSSCWVRAASRSGTRRSGRRPRSARRARRRPRRTGPSSPRSPPTPDPAAGGEIGLDHRHQPLRDPVGGLGGQPGDGVAHLGVAEPLDQRVGVVGEVDARHRRQGGDPLATHVAQQVARRRSGPGRRRGRSGSPSGDRSRRRLVTGVEQSQLHQLVRLDVRHQLDTGPRQAGRPATKCPRAPTGRTARPPPARRRHPEPLGDLGPSSSVVTGVIRSTIALGKATCLDPRRPGPDPGRRAYEVKAAGPPLRCPGCCRRTSR